MANEQNLLKGGKPGNRGGRGTITNEVRTLCREGFAKAAPRIIEIATAEADGVAPGEQIRAFEALGKYGMGELQAVALEKAEWLSIVCTVTANHLADAEVYEAWFQELLNALGSSAT